MKLKMKMRMMLSLSILSSLGVLLVSSGYTVYADGGKTNSGAVEIGIVRSAEEYNTRDFSSMSLPDYCNYFLQDINIKYACGGTACYGATQRSSIATTASSLQEVALASLGGQDTGIDCSSFVMIVLKWFGVSGDIPGNTTAWLSLTGAGGIVSDIKTLPTGGSLTADALSALPVGTVIVGRGASQHAMLYVGNVEGVPMLAHIGSAYMCASKDSAGKPIAGCGGSSCLLEPGKGATSCNACLVNNDGADQNRRFIRISKALATLKSYTTLKAFIINYPDSSRIGEYTGSTVGLGAESGSVGSLGSVSGEGNALDITYDFLEKTGTLTSEADLLGMTPVWAIDGEPVLLYDRSGLSLTEVENVGIMGEDIEVGKWSVNSIIGVVSASIGYLLLLYSAAILLGFMFDKTNNFVDISVLSLLSFGKWQVVDETEIKHTIKKNGKTFITKGGIIIRAIIVFMVGILLSSGFLVRLIGKILNIIYNL